MQKRLCLLIFNHLQIVCQTQLKGLVRVNFLHFWCLGCVHLGLFEFEVSGVVLHPCAVTQHRNLDTSTDGLNNSVTGASSSVQRFFISVNEWGTCFTSSF